MSNATLWVGAAVALLVCQAPLLLALVRSRLLLAAVLVQDGPVTSTGAKAILAAIALLLTGPIVNHALGRADRIRTTGDWRP